MKNYEMVLIVNINCTLQNINKTIEEIKNILGKDNIKFINFVGIRELYLKLQNNKFGYYVHFNFSSDKYKNLKIEEETQKNKDILKTVIVRVD